MSSHLRPDPRQRVPRSTMVASVTGVGLVVFGVVLSLWQGQGESTAPPLAGGMSDSVNGGVLDGLLNLAPTLAGILVAVVVLAGVVLYKGRPHQN